MEKATISDLKNRLSAYLKKVRAGHTILVLDRDEPVARLERVDRGAQPAERLRRLEQSGAVRRATRPVPVALLKERPPRSKRSVVQALLEERTEGR